MHARILRHVKVSSQVYEECIACVCACVGGVSDLPRKPGPYGRGFGAGSGAWEAVVVATHRTAGRAAVSPGGDSTSQGQFGAAGIVRTRDMLLGVGGSGPSGCARMELELLFLCHCCCALHPPTASPLQRSKHKSKKDALELQLKEQQDIVKELNQVGNSHPLPKNTHIVLLRGCASMEHLAGCTSVPHFREG